MKENPNLITFIKNRMKKGIQKKEIFEQVSRTFDDIKSLRSFYRFVSEIEEQDKSDSIDELCFLKQLKKNQISSIKNLSEKMGVSKEKILAIIKNVIEKGYEVSVEDGNVLYGLDVNSENKSKIESIGDTEIVFGIASDLHFGSKACQITALNDFCKEAKRQGVKHIFVPGDVYTGVFVYSGQIYDQYAISEDEQISSLLANLPKGFDWYALGGNHDYSFINRAGQNPLLLTAKYRNDFHYLGFDDVVVPILKNVDMRLWHPKGSVPYALSYRMQKGIEQIAFAELRNIANGIKKTASTRFVMCGHLHTQCQAMFGGIFGAQCGTFEGSTNYLKRLGLVPAIGGYIIKACLGSNGCLKNFEAKFHMYQEIENDYKNFNHDYKFDAEKFLSPILEK